jgi:hypothetical protein
MTTCICACNTVCAGLQNLWWRCRYTVCAGYTFGHWSILANVTLEKKIRTHVANHVRKLSNSLGNCLPPRQSCNLQTVILDKSRAYTRGNHNFQYIGFLINCTFNTKNISFNIAYTFTVKCENNLYEMCKP